MKSNTVQINRQGALCYITFPKLTRCGAVRHTFSTRLGGVSEGYFSTMNMSFNKGDDFKRVEKNYEILCSAVGIDKNNLVLSKQTHTANVRVVTAADRGTGYYKPSFEDIDGLITNEPDVALVTQYADCTPLLFCDPVKRVVATSHSGWRGTVQKIGAVTVEKMVAEFGCRREDIIAAIGPCIGRCCYEVDEPVYNAFSGIGLDTDRFFTVKDASHWMLDLREANRQILVESGIKNDNIDIADICTCCNHEELYSHRVLGEKRGNLAAIIQLI